VREGADLRRTLPDGRVSARIIMEKSIQETYAPNMACFGCGPANEKGLHIRSFPEGDEVVATFNPATYQEAFPGMLSGGIIGTLLDCHCNWTAAYHLMKQAGVDRPRARSLPTTRSLCGDRRRLTNQLNCERGLSKQKKIERSSKVS